MIIDFLIWIVKTVVASFLLAFPVALAIVVLFSNTVEYWYVYRVVFWVLIVFGCGEAVLRSWE